MTESCKILRPGEATPLEYRPDFTGPDQLGALIYYAMQLVNCNIRMSGSLDSGGVHVRLVGCKLPGNYIRSVQPHSPLGGGGGGGGE